MFLISANDSVFHWLALAVQELKFCVISRQPISAQSLISPDGAQWGCAASGEIVKKILGSLMTVEQNTPNPESSTEARANELLLFAEYLFGPMTSPWRFEGIVFQDNSPHLYYAPEDSSVQISLSLRTVDDDLQRDFQLAHEICHLLYPSVELDNPITPNVTTLNEGISTYFSVLVLAEYHGQEAAEMALQSLAEHSPNYFKAFQLTSKMLQADKDSVKKLRAIQPMVNAISAADFKSADINLSDEHVSALTATFERMEPQTNKTNC